MNYSEFPDSGQTIVGTTYLVSQDHVINGTVLIAENVTLYFITGKLTGNGVLTGKYTKVIASISQIFDVTLTVNGTWTIDRAYPQWFGAKIVRGDDDLINKEYDSSAAINKAINMKRTGAVFIPRGEYVVCNTIFVKFGINLCGETGTTSDIVGGDTITQPQGTILKPLNETGDKHNSFTANYFMMVNIKDPNNNTTQENAEWEVRYPIPVTKVKDIYFSNYYPNSKIIGLKGILVAGGFVFDSLSWCGFCQAVATASWLYNDLKQITNCTFSGGDGVLSDIYAFDLVSLGDGLVFEHNAMHDFNVKALWLSLCNGGSVTSNILNGDVMIGGCKGVTFNDNHCEGDPQIHIVVSNISLSNNFIEKGKRPSIFIEDNQYHDLSIVELNNNSLTFWDYDRSMGGFVKPVTQICEYDIYIKGDVILKMSSSFRYFIMKGQPTKLYPYGISICKSEINNEGNITGYLPFDKFNNFSQLLSSSCTIMPKLLVIKDVYVSNLNLQDIFAMIIPDGPEWLGDLDHTYTYQYSIIWDYDRRILKSELLGGNTKYKFDLDGAFKIELRNQSTLLILNGNEYVSRQIMFRLYRTDTNLSKTVYVDVPLCGTIFMYDNGFSVCGYRWRDYSDAVNGFGAVNLGINSIKFRGDNIECWSDNYPTKGNWKKGDVIYNTGTASEDKMWLIKGDINFG